ncbi:MAG: translocation/assembly module TamB [Clostridiales bacterium]|nr:translocation/assembly module TamB [Clostridiales bacterium]
MKLLYKILRAFIVILIALAITIPIVMYVGLSLPPVQRSVASVARERLSQFLGANVDIGSLYIAPFNRAMLRDVTITMESPVDTVLTIDRLGAGISIYDLVFNRETIVNYIEVVGLDLKVTRDSTGTPLNIQPIIDRLSSKDPDKPASDFTMAINTVILRDSRVRYDILNTPAAIHGHFSPHHIEISDLNTDLLLPTVGNSGVSAEIKRFKAYEHSGLQIDNITGAFLFAPDSIMWNNVSVTLPSSHIALRDFSAAIPDTVDNPISFLTDNAIFVGTSAGSSLTPADLSPICPILQHFTSPVKLQLSLDGIINDESRVLFKADAASDGFTLNADALLYKPLDSLNRALRLLDMKGHIDADPIVKMAGNNPRVAEIARLAQYVDIDIQLTASHSEARTASALVSAAGDITLDAIARAIDTASPRYDINLDLNDIHLGQLLRDTRFDLASVNISINGALIGHKHEGEIKLDINHFDWQGHPLGDITARLATIGQQYDLSLNSLDPAATLSLGASGNYGSKYKSLNLHTRLERIDLGELFPESNIANTVVQLSADANLAGDNIDNIAGDIAITGIRVQQPNTATQLTLDKIHIKAEDTVDNQRYISLDSDILSGWLSGDIYFSTLVDQMRQVAMLSLPALKNETQKASPSANRKSRRQPRPLLNDFSGQFKIHDTEEWSDILHLPISNLGESTLDYALNTELNSMSMCLYAPYLRQGNKLIEKTRLEALINGTDSLSKLSFTTRVPTQHGPLTLNLSTNAVNNIINTALNWNIERAARYDGDLSLTTQLNRINHNLAVKATINPGQLTFNDSTWTVNRATVDIMPGIVNINGINAHRSGQFVKIDGTASHIPDDAIAIDLLGVNLDYIFESLGIDKVMLGGDATGCFYASNLFSKEPRLTTAGLNVKNISYNKVVLGDAVVKSRWDNESKGITLNAVVKPDGGPSTFINGAIYPLNDSLDITFDAHDVNVAFMYPYMQAFAGDVSGRASGVARLWGNFKYIDMEGALKGDNLKIKIDFTQTTYSTNDSVTLRLGEISLKDVTIHDINGNTAKLNGKVWHKYFKEPVFDFSITDAHNLLVYDESATQNPDWYGRIYGNGSASIKGRPGVVDIGVKMSTAPGSTFTFVLNDREDASDYTFITFRNRDELLAGNIVQQQEIDDTPSTVKRLREMLAKKQEETSSDYNIDLVIDINPDAQINLIMDPVGGDRIRSRGTGDMHMTYGSRNNDLHMYGSYTLEKGNYNFTLQDIIIKDFVIKQGSKITFTGDPFNAQLNIKAAYPLTANLLDLDQSFQQDKDLNRTTVPVNAILQVTGSLQQNDITFDLEFPTLTQDTYRKVRSIVSTEEMMNRQIIYLLALNRFYTPDYMSASRGNELVSVASSTLSSQLSNILGSLSDNWNIAPTFRSDRGDFSDVEVDVALSSSLLNNRLLFNGNLGYRDKSLNNTQFVGDFDIEYLLNRAGSLRLKAYNRYNDMNYYVRTAETTQGVGVSFRRNFDNLRDLLNFNRRKRRDTTATTSPIPSTKPSTHIAHGDTIGSNPTTQD